MEDADIIDLYWSRNEQAIHETDRKYRLYCLSVSENILRDRQDSEECVNDTWLRAWNAIPPDRPIHLKMFLAKITRALSVDKLRQKFAAKRGGGEVAAVIDELAECIPSSEDVHSTIERMELDMVINNFLSTISEKERKVFLCRYFFAESIKEISERYGLKGNTIPVILSRTRQKLKKHLLKEGYGRD